MPVNDGASNLNFLCLGFVLFVCFCCCGFKSCFCWCLSLYFKARLEFETFSTHANAAPNAKEHRLLAAEGVLVSLGPSHFETTPTTEPADVATKGESRQTAKSN